MGKKHEFDYKNYTAEILYDLENIQEDLVQRAFEENGVFEPEEPESLTMAERQRLNQLRKTIQYHVRRKTEKAINEHLRSHIKKNESKKENKDKWPKKALWMEKDKIISDRLKNDKVFQAMIKIMNYLWENCRMGRDRSMRLAEEYGLGEYENKSKDKNGKKTINNWTYCFLKEIDHDLIQQKTGVGKTTIRLHLKALSNIGALKRFRKRGATGQTILAIGYYTRTIKSETGINWMTQPFLKTSMKNQLRGYSLKKED